MEDTLEDIIKFIIDYIQDNWLDEDIFLIYKNSTKINGLPIIIWNNLIHLDILILEKFPSCDKEYIRNLTHFYLISLISYTSTHENYSINDILLFTTNFLNTSLELQDALKVEYTK